MEDPVNENGRHRCGVTWRLRQPGGRIVTDFSDPIILELLGTDDSALATVSIPSETIDQLLRPHLSVLVELQLDGSISLDSEFFALFPTAKTTDIYELVREGIAPEMLEDEPDVEERLTTLRQRLSEALALVDQTLTNLDKPIT